MYQYMIHLYRISSDPTSAPLSGRRQYLALQGFLGRAQPRHDVALMIVEPMRRHRHRNRQHIAERIARHEAGGADAAGMLLAVDGDAGLAGRFQVPEQIVEPRNRAWRAPFVARADQRAIVAASSSAR